MILTRFELILASRKGAVLTNILKEPFLNFILDIDNKKIIIIDK